MALREGVGEVGQIDIDLANGDLNPFGIEVYQSTYLSRT